MRFLKRVPKDKLAILMFLIWLSAYVLPAINNLVYFVTHTKQYKEIIGAQANEMSIINKQFRP